MNGLRELVIASGATPSEAFLAGKAMWWDGVTEAQKEWANWAAHGYRKLYQPRSMLWLGGIFFALFAAGLFFMVWLAASGRWP